VRFLFLIPARAGSKGLPGKNTKIFLGKPLITYSIDFALANMRADDELCISTDDENVLAIAKKNGIHIPFIRPPELSSDEASTYDVILHAINYYKSINKSFDVLFLLQPTSPIRIKEDFEKMIAVYHHSLDMVVSVKISKENPYFTLFEESKRGFLIKSKKKNFERRQDCPNIFTFNGSMYMINMNSIVRSNINEFKKVKKVVMPEDRSVDIDTLADWVLAEFYAKNL
jgi:N-acylneuraminate cytidylyltransferase